MCCVLLRLALMESWCINLRLGSHKVIGLRCEYDTVHGRIHNVFFQESASCFTSTQRRNECSSMAMAVLGVTCFMF